MDQDHDSDSKSSIWVKSVFFTILAIVLVLILSPFVLIYVQLWRSCTDCN